jgi:hypothetical protein
MRRAQTALEFLILTGFMLFIFTAFFFVIKERSAVATEQIHYQELAAIGDIISQEVTLAAQVRDGYNRTFTLPYTAGEEPYTITLPSQTEVDLRSRDSQYLLFLTANVSAPGNVLLPGRNMIWKRNGTLSINSLG